MSTNLLAAVRAAEMTQIVTSAGAAAHFFCYSGAPPTKVTTPSGTSIITGGQALSATVGTTGTDGIDAGTKLTLSGTPFTPTSAYTGTPGYYRIVIGATDDGTHTLIQGLCTITYPSTGYTSVTLACTHDTYAVTLSATPTPSGGTPPPALAIGQYLTNISGDASAGTYLIVAGSGTTWTIGTPFNPGGSSATTSTWNMVTAANALQFSSTVASGGTITLSSATWTEGNP